MIATWDDQCQSLRKEFTPKPNSYFPTLRIDPSAKVHLTAGEFDTTLPPLSLTIFSTFQRAHRRPGIITD